MFLLKSWAASPYFSLSKYNQDGIIVERCCLLNDKNFLWKTWGLSSCTYNTCICPDAARSFSRYLCYIQGSSRVLLVLGLILKRPNVLFHINLLEHIKGCAPITGSSHCSASLRTFSVRPGAAGLESFSSATRVLGIWWRLTTVSSAGVKWRFCGNIRYQGCCRCSQWLREFLLATCLFEWGWVVGHTQQFSHRRRSLKGFSRTNNWVRPQG